eukprot:TRINITY_DN43255_c0_g2_i1.p1 TRINITY_DN43255_c0_g2~~TRINITY_DN43255_c0_g2_i1.p1  ORF type:complete len:205 (+),score=51.51 TRINITY_DN43255_c0_g2_i1:174-788(+)
MAAVSRAAAEGASAAAMALPPVPTTAPPQPMPSADGTPQQPQCFAQQILETAVQNALQCRLEELAAEALALADFKADSDVAPRQEQQWQHDGDVHEHAERLPVPVALAAALEQQQHADVEAQAAQEAPPQEDRHVVDQVQLTSHGCGVSMSLFTIPELFGDDDGTSSCASPRGAENSYTAGLARRHFARIDTFDSLASVLGLTL